LCEYRYQLIAVLKCEGKYIYPKHTHSHITLGAYAAHGAPEIKGLAYPESSSRDEVAFLFFRPCLGHIHIRQDFCLC